MSDRIFLRVGDNGVETRLTLFADGLHKRSGGAWVESWAAAQAQRPDLVAEHARLSRAALDSFCEDHGATLEEKFAIRAAGRQVAESFGAARSAQKPVLGPFEALVDRIHREKFNGDPQKYSDALELAGQQRPDLRDAYLRHADGPSETFGSADGDDFGRDLSESLAALSATLSAAHAELKSSRPEKFEYPVEARGVAGLEFSPAVVALARKMAAAKLSGADADLLFETAIYAREKAHGAANKTPLMLSAGV